MHLYDSSKKLSKYYLLVSLFVSVSNHQLLPSKNDFTKIAKEVLETAPNFIFEPNFVGGISEESKSVKWLQKYVGILCSNATFEVKERNGILNEENFKKFQKMQRDFCRELTVGERVNQKTMTNMVTQFFDAFAKDETLNKEGLEENLREYGKMIGDKIDKIWQAPESSAKIQNLLKKVESGLKQFVDAMKEHRLIVKKQQRVGRREKRMDQQRTGGRTLDIEQPAEPNNDQGSSSSHGSSSVSSTPSSGGVPPALMYTLETPLRCAMLAAITSVAFLLLILPSYHVFYGDATAHYVALFTITLVLIAASLGLFFYHNCVQYIIFRVQHMIAQRHTPI